MRIYVFRVHKALYLHVYLANTNINRVMFFVLNMTLYKSSSVIFIRVRTFELVDKHIIVT